MKPTNTWSPSKFQGPGDPNYVLLVSEMTRCLLLKASSDNRLHSLLGKLIESHCKLDVKDYRGRSPLHRAAEAANYVGLKLLVSARSDLVAGADNDERTPLHVVIRAAVEDRSAKREENFSSIISTLVSALDENNFDDDKRDTFGKTAWEYAWDDDDRWILDLRLREILDGATQPDVAEDYTKPRRLDLPQLLVAKKSEAILTQFYIDRNATRDFLSRQRPDVFAVVYDTEYGLGRLFSGNVSNNARDKQTTCRWIHLPANNVSRPYLRPATRDERGVG